MEAPLSSRSNLNPPVFFGSTLIIACLVIYSTVFKDNAQRVFGATPVSYTHLRAHET